MAYFTIEGARALLPKIGDVRWERPTADATTGHFYPKARQKCVVVDVHAEHLWYTVQFENGIKESYKVPQPTDGGGGQNG